jgi:hypothetical protein
MRLLISILTIGLVVASSTSVEAAVGKKKAAKQKQAKKHGELSTSHDFDDHGVRGEYQMPDEALAKVENEKLLGDLLGVRKHFKDRLIEASEQE